MIMAKRMPSHGDPVRTEPHAATKAPDSITPSMPMLKMPERSAAASPMAASPIAMPSLMVAASNAVMKIASITRSPFGSAMPIAPRQRRR